MPPTLQCGCLPVFQVKAQRRLPLGRPHIAELLGLSRGSCEKSSAVNNGMEQLALQPGAVRWGNIQLEH